jgi:cation diffusion facilitator CzcD-associated flavoprotein CzcO
MGRSLDVAIVGAGMSGLFLGYHLKRSGIGFTIYDKGDAVGGTWRDNTYPGLHVDVTTRRYEFPFARSTRWSRRYAPGTEIRRYLVGFAGQHGLAPHLELGTEVVDATYDRGRWGLTMADGRRRVADVVVAATGFLRVPRRPSIPGVSTFAGASFHSSQWDHSISLDGKRIGVVGTGSSGVQIVSELGRRGHDVTHFIRTPHWIQTKPNPRISGLERFLLRFPVLAGYWDRRIQRLRVKIDGSEFWRLEPGAERDEMTRRFIGMLRKEIRDPELRAKLTPTEPLGCRRIPKSPNYYQVVQRNNVQCVFGGIQGVHPDGIIDETGTAHPLDVIVYATGFHTHAYMRPMTVNGVDGVSINELWSDGIFSYRGVALPSMPNFFLLNGPFAPVNSIAIPTCLHDEVGFLLRLLDVTATEGVALAPTPEATRRFRDEVGAALPDTTYALCDSWFTDQAGTPIVWPFSRQHHEDQYATLDLDEFDRFPVSTTNQTADHAR